MKALVWIPALSGECPLFIMNLLKSFFTTARRDSNFSFCESVGDSELLVSSQTSGCPSSSGFQLLNDIDFCMSLLNLRSGARSKTGEQTATSACLRQMLSHELLDKLRDASPCGWFIGCGLRCKGDVKEVGIEGNAKVCPQRDVNGKRNNKEQMHKQTLSASVSRPVHDETWLMTTL